MRSNFGTGFSSLGYLRRFPFDMLKVERAFVDDVDASAVFLEILRAVVALGSLGMSVIVEGIEGRTQAERARRAGWRLGQGYLFARPMPFVDLAGLIKVDDREARSAA